jgi:uncharacterized RmlC-like cupin family protein
MAGRLYHVRASDLSPDTGQTAGMRRRAAVAASTVGSRALFMGETRVAPSTTSGPHHHGRSETAIYVVSGHPVFVYRDGDREVRLDTEPGDFVYVPPRVPHIEANPDPHEEAVVVLARTTQEAIVENLEAL